MTNKDWIPINEKLPLNYEEVLISTVDDTVFVANYFAEGFFAIDSLSVPDIDLENVLAWMPMPKSYKAESEDRNDK